MPGSWQPKTRCLPLLTLPALPLPTLPSPCCSQREWNRNRRSPSPPPLEGVRDPSVCWGSGGDVEIVNVYLDMALDGV